MIRTVVALLLGFVVCGPALAKPPLWDKAIRGKGRFKVLKQFGKEAVLDKDTGLVWDRSPSLNVANWYFQSEICLLRAVGGRLGFRLPRAEELLSLVEVLESSDLSLPSGHPFSDVDGGIFWSSSMSPSLAEFGSTSILVLDLASGNVDVSARSGGARAWCVRGGAGEATVPLP